MISSVTWFAPSPHANNAQTHNTSHTKKHERKADWLASSVLLLHLTHPPACNKGRSDPRIIAVLTLEMEHMRPGKLLPGIHGVSADNARVLAALKLFLGGGRRSSILLASWRCLLADLTDETGYRNTTHSEKCRRQGLRRVAAAAAVVSFL